MAEVERIQIPGSTAMTTRVGFGCSNLLGDKTRDVGLRLLSAAYEAGICHYDVARVYNFGDAEALVGEFAQGKRERLTITTKFGLMPRGGVAKLKGPVQVVRRIMRSSQIVRKLVRRNVKSLTQAGQFDVATAQQSLETSLRTLKTDYIDIYLLHESNVSDCTDEIMAFLLRAKEEGKILAFGCGTAFSRVPAIAAIKPEFLQVAQFESSLLSNNLSAFGTMHPEPNRLIVTHGEMGAAAVIKKYLSPKQATWDQWNQGIGVDLQHGSNLYGLLLAAGLHANANGMVLFRAAAPERIRSTMQASDQIHLTEAQFGCLGKLAEAAAGETAT